MTVQHSVLIDLRKEINIKKKRRNREMERRLECRFLGKRTARWRQEPLVEVSAVNTSPVSDIHVGPLDGSDTFADGL